jgi:hypothetical protein
MSSSFREEEKNGFFLKNGNFFFFQLSDQKYAFLVEEALRHIHFSSSLEVNS